MACSTRHRPNWFIAIPIDLGQMYSHVIGRPIKQVRVIRQEDLHLTLAFLGAIEKEAALELWKSLEISDLKTIFLALGKVGSFGPQEKPSAYGICPAAANEDLSKLFRHLVSHVLSVTGIDVGTRRFRPHITFARPKRAPNVDERLQAKEWAFSRDFSLIAPMILSKLALYTWNEDRDVKLFRIVDQKYLTPSIDHV